MPQEQGAKIIQIIPAVGWYAVYDEDTPDEHIEPLTFWALTNDGDVIGQTADFAAGVGEKRNFTRYRHRSQARSAESSGIFF
jgi:hypothetical protein